MLLGLMFYAPRTRNLPGSKASNLGKLVAPTESSTSGFVMSAARHSRERAFGSTGELRPRGISSRLRPESGSIGKCGGIFILAPYAPCAVIRTRRGSHLQPAYGSVLYRRAACRWRHSPHLPRGDS